MALYINFLIILLFAEQISHTGKENRDKIIIDSHITLTQALSGKEIPHTNAKNLKIIDVEYYSFDHKIHRGQLVIHKDLEEDIKEIFALIKEKRFPVKKVVPVSAYHWSDEVSMRDDNTSAFNYRFVSGTRTFSAHSLGRAIDINPFQNPQIKNGKTSPEGAVYNKFAPGTISKESWVIYEFYKRGWRWGGDWNSLKDYQHFEKMK
jgi:hypothetical protein